MSKKFTSMTGMTGVHRVTLVREDPVEFVIIGADIMRWEQSNKGASFYQGEVGLSRMSFVAWAAMKRLGLTETIFSDFMKNLVELESEDDEPDEQLEDEDEGVELGDPTGPDTPASWPTS